MKVDYKKYENYDLSILTEGERKVLLAKMEHEELTAKDIAIICGMSQQTVYAYLDRAKSKLEGTFDYEKYKERSKKYKKENQKKVRVDYKKYENYDLSILTEGERKVLLAKMEHEELTATDIAIMCDTTPRSVGGLLSRAKSKLEGTFDYEKYKERSKKYNKEHSEKVRERVKKYDKEHPEKVRERKQKYYNKNKEKMKEWKHNYALEYYKKNKEKFKKYNAEYYEKNKENIIRKQKERSEQTKKT